MKLIKLKSEIKYMFENNCLTIYVPTHGQYCIKGLSSIKYSKFLEFREGVEINSNSCENTIAVFTILQELDLLMPVEKNADIFKNRTESWISNFGEIAKYNLARSFDKKIIILGIGGIGSHVFQQLLQIGFYDFTLVDAASVNESDLNRQGIFTKKQIGTDKVVASSDYAKREFNNTSIKCVKEFVDSVDQLIKLAKSCSPSIVFSCIDQPEGKCNLMVTKAMKYGAIPIIFCEVGISEAFIGPLLVTKNEKELYIKYCENRKVQENESRPIIQGSISFTNAIAAGLMVRLGLNVLAPFTQLNSKNIYRINFRNLKIDKTGIDDVK